jgi:hypothetical protein
MSSSPPSRISHVLFCLWVIGGAVWAAASWYVWECFLVKFPNEHSQQTLVCVNPGPKEQARQQLRDRLVLAGRYVDLGSIVYAAVGAVLFRRSGYGVIAVAVAIVFMTWWMGNAKVDFW